MATLPLDEIQGVVLRGYTLDAVRHFVLRVTDAAGGRRFIGAITPRITTSAEWTTRPASCLNIGLTAEGLQALAIPAASLASFPQEFKEGAAARAAVVGDTGTSAPPAWKLGLGAPGVHAILSLYAADATVLEGESAALRALMKSSGGVAETGCQDGHKLPDDRIHFNYKDGIAQPNIDGGPERLADMQPLAPPGEFLLGYPSQYKQFSYDVPQPDVLGRNGSFAAFRILEQDCHAFATFIDAQAASLGISSDLMQAKFCGRWPNGVPLALSPDTDTPATPIAPDQINNFDYVTTPENPSVVNDAKGLRCPVGAHIRRNNPRSQPVIGGSDGHNHRIVRRGMPYGPPFDPAHPNDGAERGLVGLFIGVSIENQFEFLMSQWVNDGVFTAGLGGTKDPILGDSTAADSKFTLPMADGKKQITGFGRFVTTRGGAYCFLPSIPALKYLGSLA
jgi:deferrochelatase/peroxidase EfeB